MTSLIRRAALVAAIATAGLTPPDIAHAAAHTPAEMPCPDGKVCAWTMPYGKGEQVVYDQWEAAGFIDPPVSSVQNRTEESWCFYSRPLFSVLGENRRINPGETVESLGFRAQSAHRAGCRRS
ncbi:peptidase inhibitor family I36 protein [Nonomuraea sp. M3C6]|uniref:Peptidase inhibitor family I36 protein n=1 Tax=Nonomuraea marmarensis TaxID=3351344 RepID=A0ABW7ADG4_9ACTN